MARVILLLCWGWGFLYSAPTIAKLDSPQTVGRQWLCFLKGRMILDRDYFYSHGRDAWYGPAQLTCKDQKSGRVVVENLVMGFQSQIPSQGLLASGLIEISSDVIEVSNPSLLMQGHPTFSEKSLRVPLNEIELLAQTPQALWLFELRIPETIYPFINSLLSPGTLWLERAQQRRIWQ